MNKKDFLKQVAGLAAQFRRLIEAEQNGLDPNPKSVAERRTKVFDPVHGFEFFVNTYFPHYTRSPHKSQLHEYLFFRLPEILNSPKSEMEADAAPRGEAKSTLVSRLFPLWCMVTGRKRFYALIMDSIDQAYPMLESIKAELEFNPRLIMDFPEATGQGRVWQAGTIITKNDIKVQVAGSGKKMRGWTHGPYRPDLIVLDDIENDEQVRNPEQRDKLESWLKSTVLHLGGVGEKADVIYIGTILHYDSVLNRTLNNPMWRSKKFKAMLQWPERMDLWDEREAILRNNGNAGAAMAQAMQFWTSLPNDLVYFGALDPSLGKAGASRDPSAILVGGYQRSSGKLFVVEAQIKKRLPDLIIEDVIRLHKQYHCAMWFVETVQFQEFLKDELVKRSAQRGYPVPARAVKPNSDKMLRIETLQPHMANGLIWLHSSQATLIEQLRHFPKAAHDDGPDALQMLWAGVVSNAAPIEWRSTSDDDFDDHEFQSKWTK